MILVTGGTGFIGTHVVRRLASTTPKGVRLLVRSTGAVPISDGPQIVRGDIGDQGAIEKAVEGIDTIVHMASKNIDADGHGFYEINVEGTRTLCNAACREGVKKLIYISTTGVYGHGIHRGVEETTPLNPDTPFSRSKASAEALLLDACQRGRIKVVLLRHRFVYGEGDLYVIPRLLEASRRYPFQISRGRARTAFILVDDAAEVISALATREFPHDSHPVFHLTDGESYSYAEINRVLRSLFDIPEPRRNAPFFPLYAAIRGWEFIRGVDPETSSSSISSLRIKLIGRDNYFSNAKLRALFPDFRFTTFAEGMANLRTYYSKERR